MTPGKEQANPTPIYGARPIYNGTTYRLHDHLRKPNRFVSCPGGCGKMTRGSLCKTCEAARENLLAERDAMADQ